MTLEMCLTAEIWKYNQEKKPTDISEINVENLQEKTQLFPGIEALNSQGKNSDITLD